MKKTVVALAVAVMVLGTMSVAFAGASWGPAAIFAGEKGITEEAAYELRTEADMTFGELAKEEGFYENFKTAALEQKESMLGEMVAAGEMTEAEAEEILAIFADCDGTQKETLKGTVHFGQKAQDGQGNGIKAMDGEGEQKRQGNNGQGLKLMKGKAGN